MACGACSNAIDKILGRLDGVESRSVSLEKQTVTVKVADKSSLSYDTVLEKIKKSGREVHGGSII